LNQVGAYSASVAGAISAAVTTTNTAFLLQSTAFISSPADPKPEQVGGGVWIRAVGGAVKVKDPSTTNVSLTTTAPGVTQAGPINCDTQIDQTFAGVQFGQDIAKLNVNGWNFHLGTTAGYLEAKGSTVGGTALGGGAFDSTVQAPFLGAYAALTKGAFFADALVRADYYQTNINSPTINIFNQKLDAHGFSAAVSAGYHHNVEGSSWFIEPSAGVIYSRTSVDPLNLAGAPLGAGGNIQGTVQINDITSTVGRAGVRIGTTVTTPTWVLQPFAAASIWHEFGNPVTANYTTCPGCAVVNPGAFPATVTGAYTGTTVGTYGQYSLGLSGQLINTGWVGFVRVDYRNGSNLQGWDGTGGIRYHFTPEMVAAAGPIIAKAPVKPLVVAYNWTGFYAGGNVGAAYGTSSLGFTGGVGNADPRLAGFLGGVQAGYNRQNGLWVLGVEAEWDWTNAIGSKACGGALGPIGVVAMWNSTCHTTTDWIATFAGRVGYAWTDRTLIYVKAGGAWTRVTFSATCNLGPLNGPGAFGSCVNPAGMVGNALSATETRGGWLIGYGTEFALTAKWSAKAEFNYIGFGSRNVTASDGTVINGKLNVSETKIGMNYHF
jgi:outer membrane autotransporter protein